MPYIGNAAGNRFVASKAASVYSGNGSTTAFTLEHAVGSDEDILVSVDGVIQEPSVAYAVSSGTTLTFTAAPSSNSGNNIFVYYLFRTVGTVSHPSTSSLQATDATFTGAVTANAGVVVDNITIDGTEIDLSSGDLTLDVAGDIILDADGADVSFRDGGTGHLSISNSSNDAVITSLQNDKDMIFKGVDGGSVVTALTLDMSDAGTAVFNKNITVTDGSIASGVTHTFNLFGATGTGGNANYATYSFVGDPNTGMFSGTADTLKFATGGSERMRINANGQLLLGTTTSRGKLTIGVDSSSADGLYLDNANGSATMDLALLGSGYNAHGANAGEIWFYSPDNINIGGATGNTNSIKFLGGGSERMRIDANGYLTQSKLPMFNIIGGGHTIAATGQTTITSSNGFSSSLEYDPDNLFDHSNGRFTAPVAGRYFFIFSIGIQFSSGYHYSYIFKNGANVAGLNRNISQNSSQFEVQSIQAVLNLASGDYVTAERNNNNVSGTVDGAMFSGFLLG